MAMYRRLPHGWRTKPEGTWSDLYMWQQILSMPGLRTASGARPTVLHFPSSLRRGWPMERRIEELDRWAARMTEPGWRADLLAAVLANSWAGHTSAWEGLQEHRRALEELRAAEAIHRERETDLLDQIRRLGHDRAEERRSLDGQLADLRAELRSRERELAAIRSTRTWRWRERSLRLPVIGSLARRGRGRSRPGAP
jgi:hypothetical protein